MLSLVALYFFLRANFLFTNKNIYQDYSFFDLAYSFVKGLRFDLSTIILTNIIFIGVYFFPKPHFINRHRVYRYFLVLLLLIVNIPCLLMNIGDANYFRFIGRRSSVEVLKILDDVLGHMGSTLSTYLSSLFVFLVVSFLLFVFYKKVLIKPVKPLSFLKQFILFIFVVPFVVLGARGGFQSKPLRPIEAFAPEKTELGHLILNTTFTVIKSRLNDSLPEKKFYSYQKVQEILSQQAQEKTSELNPKKIKPNIVIIAFEGLSAKYVGRLNKNNGHLTPFFDKLSKEGTLFANHFANGRRSMEAFPALFWGAPSLSNMPLPISIYSTNRYLGLATHLEKVGYSSAFYHSANYNSSFTHSSAKIAGFKKLISGQDYPNSSDHNGAWGVHDEPYLKYYAKELSNLPQPFVTGVLTLSSHHPYAVPEKYIHEFPEITSPVLRSFRYTDLAIESFFREAKKQPWYDNTLFILTGDHTNQGESFTEKYSGVELFRVPMLFFSPNSDLKIKKNLLSHRITQHSDLPKTLYSLLGINPKEQLPFGKNMFAKNSEGEALLRSASVYYLVNHKHVLSMVSDSASEAKMTVFERNDELLDMKILPKNNEDVKATSQKLKAYLQYFNNQMIKNDLYSWKVN